MTAIYLFFAAFITVFALGFQQQNVTGRHYVAAVLTSVVIGATAIDIAATLAGGPAGIVAAMYAHPRIARRWRARKGTTLPAEVINEIQAELQAVIRGTKQ